MKRYLIFALSFLLLLLSFQIFSGMLLTYFYTPDIQDAWQMSGNMGQEIVVQRNDSSLPLTFVNAFLAASVAYFISNKFLGPAAQASE
ncbi:hypothetical protein [Virgibacillus kimchii]